jgi:hypothetical protein
MRVSHPAQILLKGGLGNYWTLVASSLLHVWCTFTEYLSLFGMSNVQNDSHTARLQSVCSAIAAICGIPELAFCPKNERPSHGDKRSV